MAQTTLEDRDRQLLTGKNFAHVATYRQNGRVHLVPVWVDVDDDGRILLNGTRGRAWLRNLDRDGRVTLAVQNLEDPYEYVEIVGRATVGEPGEGAEDHIDKLAQRHFGTQYPDHREDDPRLWVVVTPEAVHHHGGS